MLRKRGLDFGALKWHLLATFNASLALLLMDLMEAI
jgi:hypothetical protein